MFKKVMASLFMLAGLAQAVFSQSNVTNLKNSFAPASPEAAILFKFQDIPVSKYTGTADITIPVVNVQSKSFNLPISLSYHSAGIKVSEVASYTGLGWQLNAGGMISRKVRGYPDDGPQGYMNRTNWYSAVYTPLSAPSHTETYTTRADNMTSGNNYEDTEPDEFYFSFGGYTGKMMFKQTAAITGLAPLVVSCKVPLQVTYVTAGPAGGIITSWVIVTPDGLRYTFSVKETTNTTVEPLDLCNILGTYTEYTSSWYLASISSGNGFSTASAQFTYDDYSVDYDWLSSRTETHNSFSGNGCLKPIPNPAPSINYSRNRVFIAGKKIKEIYFADSKTYVDFIYLNNRQDMNATLNNKSLDAVIVSRDTGFTTPGRKRIQKAEMKYGYKGGRLMLESVQQAGNDDVTKTPPHEFVYNSEELPDRITGAERIDHWGYYNGSAPGTNFLPSYKELNFGNRFYYSLPASQGGRSNRNCNTAYTKAQVLEKIKYPTGGITSLGYELNRYGFIQNQSVIGRQEYDLRDTVVSLLVNGTGFDAPDYKELSLRFEVPASSLAARTLRFRVDGSMTVCYVGGEGQTFCPSHAFPIGELYKELSPGNLTLIQRFALNPSFTDGLIELPDEGPGIYVLKGMATTRPSPLSGGTDAVYVELRWKYNLPGSLVVDMPAGGLRVKEISDFDSTGGIAKVRRFDYNMPYNGTNLSSGVIYTEPKYLYTSYPVVEIPPTGGPGYTTYCTSKTIMGNSSIQTELTNGSHIGYQQVTDWEEKGGASNGKIVTQYTSPYIYQDAVNTVKPFGPPITQSYKTGLVQREGYYNNQQQLLKEDKYEYAFFEHHIPFVKVSKGIVECPCPAGGGDINSPCASNFYSDINADGENDKYSRWMGNLHIGFAQLKKEIHNQDGFSIEKSYEYDSSLQRIKRIVVKNNPLDKDSIIMTYKYPGDEAGMTGLSAEELQAIGRLKDFGMTTTVLEENKQRQNTNTIRIRYHYKNFDPAQQGSKTAQSGLSIQNAGGPLERKYDIDQYNNFGNVVQQRKVNDFASSYIWDDFTGNPTAEVSNTTVNNIAFTSFESDFTYSSGWQIGAGTSYTRHAAEALTGRCAYQLANGNITKAGLTAGNKYVISYWSKNGAYNVSGIAPVAGRTNGLGWTYYEHITNNTTTAVTISGAGLIDELRLYPENAEMVTYTYEPGAGTLSSNSADNIISFYEYDALNRLKAVRDQDGNILQLSEYQYQKLERNTTPDWRDVTPIQSRCETGMDLGAGNNYLTGYLVKKQVDVNVYSATYNQNKWTRTFIDNVACPVTPDWQYYGWDCVLDNCGNITGAYRNIERDNNPYSPTYNQTRLTAVIGTNTTICPVSSACTAEGYKKINNVCVLGQKIITSNYDDGCYRVTVYHYEWSCGPASGDYTRSVRIPGCVIPQ
jgi:YD repeat-containing protein